MRLVTFMPGSGGAGSQIVADREQGPQLHGGKIAVLW